MRKVKKTCIVLFVSALVAVVSGCTSMGFVSDAGAFPADASTYEVLGRVSIETSAKKSGYGKLYQEAKDLYPETDDVVNVKVDKKRTVFLFFSFESYEMSGIAISYK
ncbi:MAG: hypothetical protein J1E32_07680 [Treponema sp.]|nr:hypothetical protein [Treponema sp.]